MTASLGDIWTVLAPGPSLRLIKPEDVYADGPIVVVNNAVLSDLPRDFWCVLDTPTKFEQVWRNLPIDSRKRLGLVWCRELRAPEWRKLHFRCWPFAEQERDFRAQNLPQSKDRKVSMLNLTILAAVSRCIGLGARRVECFGVDMAGRGHSHGFDPEQGRGEEVWRDRWNEELHTFAMANVEWQACGVEVVRKSPAV